MAKADLNSWDGFIGRVGDTVTYIRMGKLVKRKIGKSYKPATESQRKYRTKVKIANEFISSVKGFILHGMRPQGLIQQKTPNDLMLAHLMSNGMITGDYPNQEINFPAVRFSEGIKEETKGLQVSLIESGLEFSWDTETLPANCRHDDMLMVIVYYPQLKKADFEAHGAKRLAGKFQFSLDRNEMPALMETYAAFMSADGKRVSTSVYLGQFTLPADKD
jgi:hypothetical protein